ncbi:portal protein [Escherichia coli]|nr:portal protein [Escherichia coli]
MFFTCSAPSTSLTSVRSVSIRLMLIQDRIREINGWLGQEVIRFKNYSLDTDNG